MKICIYASMITQLEKYCVWCMLQPKQTASDSMLDFSWKERQNIKTEWLKNQFMYDCWWGNLLTAKHMFLVLSAPLWDYNFNGQVFSLKTYGVRKFFCKKKAFPREAVCIAWIGWYEELSCMLFANDPHLEILVLEAEKILDIFCAMWMHPNLFSSRTLDWISSIYLLQYIFCLEMDNLPDVLQAQALFWPLKLN